MTMPVLAFPQHHQGRWELPEGAPGGEEGRAGRAAEGVHQRMEEAALQGGGKFWL